MEQEAGLTEVVTAEPRPEEGREGRGAVSVRAAGHLQRPGGRRAGAVGGGGGDTGDKGRPCRAQGTLGSSSVKWE